MEQIRQAVERAKANAAVAVDVPPPLSARKLETPQHGGPSLVPELPRPSSAHSGANLQFTELALDREHLEAHRIIAHNAMDPRSKSFDMLRTQVLQSMGSQNWQVLAVTSPASGCGKTVTAINLALSIARQPERSVILVDMDLQRPQFARCLGLTCQRGVLGVLEGRTPLANAFIQAHVGAQRLMILAAEAPTVHSSELIASRTMRTMLHDIKAQFPSCVVILDMPPMLVTDDVMALLPHIDCALLVAAVGISTVHEIKQCKKLLQSTGLVGLVLNKAMERSAHRHY